MCMKRWAGVALPALGLTATLWLGALVLREERGPARARSRDKNPTTEVSDPEGCAAEEASTTEPGEHAPAVEEAAAPTALRAAPMGP
jgi:hypothetical protein